MTDEDSPHRKLSSFWPKSKYLVRDKRHEPTPTEAIIWKHLRQHQQDGLRFRRQHPIGQYFVDFYCPAAKLAIEIDGGIHQTTQTEDAQRQQYIESVGIAIIRFSTQQVLSNPIRVIDDILQICKQRIVDSTG
jgi:very-short-patch-repair endonuclease